MSARTSRSAIGLVLAVMLGSPLVHWQKSRQAPIAPLASDIAGARLAPPDAGGLAIGRVGVQSIKTDAPGTLRYGVLQPAGSPVADLIFLHGHGDRLDNHFALFRAWQQVGVRVIAFDWPSHGESNVGPLDIYDTDDQIRLIQLVERATLEDRHRPLLISGWSYGGLVATRLLEQPAALAGLSRRPAGAVLLAPGVAVLPFVGGDGIARVETLLHAPYPRLAGPPIPISPLQNPVFAARTLAMAWTARQQRLPADIPLLVIAAGDTEDWYVDTLGILAWARQQRFDGASLSLLQCPGARHGLDNEPYPIGTRVRTLSGQFVKDVLASASASSLPVTAAGDPSADDGQACVPR